MSTYKNEYKILYSQSLEDLEIQVKEHMSDGYELVGGVAVDGTGLPNLFHVYQAVNRRTLRSSV